MRAAARLGAATLAITTTFDCARRRRRVVSMIPERAENQLGRSLRVAGFLRLGADARNVPSAAAAAEARTILVAGRPS